MINRTGCQRYGGWRGQLLGVVSLAVLATPVWASTPQSSQWLFMTSLWTKHFNPKPEHNNHQDLINLEYQMAPSEAPFDGLPARPGLRYVVGAAAFRNSFAQHTEYAYAGVSQRWWGDNHLNIYGKLTAGLIHGYRGEYQDKIPLNGWGIAPAALPAAGIHWGPVSTELVLFGSAGMMWTGGVRF